jgi:UDP-N-acetylmuramoyl-L-alanyl-D-glutamate--2,6-diaminopimelate ligase
MDKLLHIIKRFIPKKLFKILQPPYHFLMNWVAAVVYRFPSEEMIVIGVTGTTGKTTTVYIMAKTLEKLDFKVGYTSTAMFNDGEKEWSNDKKMTMIGRFFTQKILKRMLKNNCQIAIIETTSEGIVQYRHRFINYDYLVFTGLYPEHIESHGSFENYKAAKSKLFSHLKDCRHKYTDNGLRVKKNASGLKKTELNRVDKLIIANGEDEHKDHFLSFAGDEKWEYFRAGKRTSESQAKVLSAYDCGGGAEGISFRIENEEFQMGILGEFNIINTLPAIIVANKLGKDHLEIGEALRSVKGTPGRLEKIKAGNFIIIVDYAFEPNALRKLYETLKNIEHNRIINVLGSAGGGRDKARRPILGEIAGKNADLVIVTNEDPYDEDPEIIIDQVALGAERAGKKMDKDLYKISDRREAIKKALKEAKEGDIVVISGKGNEQYICAAKGEKIPWDDRKVCYEILSEIEIHPK